MQKQVLGWKRSWRFAVACGFFPENCYSMICRGRNEVPRAGLPDSGAGQAGDESWYERTALLAELIIVRHAATWYAVGESLALRLFRCQAR